MKYSKNAFWMSVSLVLMAALIATGGPIATAAPIEQQARGEVSEGRSISFEPNVGQFDARVAFVARTPGATTFITSSETVFSVAAGPASSAVLRMRFSGGRERTEVLPGALLPGRASYIRGDDQAAWRTNVPTYADVRAVGVYSGVDVAYYGAGDSLEYDVIVAPGADPSVVEMSFEGADDIRVDEAGDLVLRVGTAEVRHLSPVVYQEGVAGKEHVSARFDLRSGGTVGFDLAGFDSSRPLVIDPVVRFSTFLGGSASQEASNDEISDVVVDATGATYIAGSTTAADFPTTAGVIEATNSGGLFISKIAPDGRSFAYSTFLGGTNASLIPGGIAVDGQGTLFVTATIVPTAPGVVRFPTTPGAYDETFGDVGVSGADAVVARIDATGSRLLYATYLGGSSVDYAFDIAVDGVGRAIIVGMTSGSFPTTRDAIQSSFGGGTDAFVAKLSSKGNKLVYATYLGGSGEERAAGVSADTEGQAVVVGRTTSSERDRRTFPTTPGAVDATAGGFADAFITRIDPQGQTLVSSTRLGGAGDDEARDVAIDPSGDAYMLGMSTSGASFPVTPGAFSGSLDTAPEPFVAKVPESGRSLAYSTFLGSPGLDASSIAVGASGNAHVAGATQGLLTTRGNVIGPHFGGGFTDAFILQLDRSGGSIVFATYLGGVGSERASSIAVSPTYEEFVVVGGKVSVENQPESFPTVPGSVTGPRRGGDDAFIARIDGNGGTLTYSGLLGGSAAGSSDVAASVATDGNGNCVVAGITSSTNFPTTAGALSGDLKGVRSFDGFAATMSADGRTLLAATYFGGADDEYVGGVAVDGAGNVYVAGSTSSSDFPVTQGAARTERRRDGGDGFVIKLSPALSSLAYSTLFDGGVTAIAVDRAGAAHIVGVTQSPNLPVTASAVSRQIAEPAIAGDAFVATINPAGSRFDYVTYLGGEGGDRASAIFVGASGERYVVGRTSSARFPTTPGAFDRSAGNLRGDDAFAAKIAPGGASLEYSTYLAGEKDDAATGVAVDSAGVAYVVGTSQSRTWPKTAGAYEFGATEFGGVFVTKVDPTGGSLLASALFAVGMGNGIALAPSGDVWITGTTNLPTFPSTSPADGRGNGSDDAYVMAFDSNLTRPRIARRFGGVQVDTGLAIAVSNSGAVYVAGATQSQDFPTLDARQRRLGGSVDAFIIAIDGTPVTAPEILSVRAAKAGRPFKLKLQVRNVQPGAMVFIGSSTTPYSSVAFKGDGLVISGGDSLLSLFPRSVATTIRIVNPDGGSTTTTFTR